MAIQIVQIVGKRIYQAPCSVEFEVKAKIHRIQRRICTRVPPASASNASGEDLIGSNRVGNFLIPKQRLGPNLMRGMGENQHAVV